MFTSGAPGLYNAPLTKALLLLSAMMSIVVSLTQTKRFFTFPDLSSVFTEHQFWRLLTYHFAFTSSAELLFGLILLYFFRLFERQMGTPKFAGFTLTVMCISTLLQIALYVVFPLLKNTTSGMYFLIYACFALYFNCIPPTQQFRIFGIRANDKLIPYILGVQLLFVNYPSSLLNGLCGFASGIVYLYEPFRLRNLQFPKRIAAFFRRFVLPLLQSPRVAQTNPVALPNTQGTSLNSVGGSTNSIRQRNGSFIHNSSSLQPTDYSSGAFNISATRMFEMEEEQEQTANLFQPALPNEQMIAQLMSMGFSLEASLQALQRTNNNVEMATNLLLDEC